MIKFTKKGKIPFFTIMHLRYLIFLTAFFVVSGLIYKFFEQAKEFQALEGQEFILSHQKEVDQIKQLFNIFENEIKNISKFIELEEYYHQTSEKTLYHSKKKIDEFLSKNMSIPFFDTPLPFIKNIHYMDFDKGIILTTKKTKPTHIETMFDSNETGFKFTEDKNSLYYKLLYYHHTRPVGQFIFSLNISFIYEYYILNQNQQIYFSDQHFISKNSDHQYSIFKTKNFIGCHNFIINNQNVSCFEVTKIPLYFVSEIKKQHKHADEMYQMLYTFTFVLLLLIFLLVIAEYFFQKSQKEKQVLEEKLFNAGKLASIGTLASGVAHELNNPLTSIIGFMTLIKKRTKEPHLMEWFNKIEYAAIRMSSIVDRLRTFGRIKRNSKNYFLLSYAISNCLVLIEKKLFEEDIKLEINNPFQNVVLFGDITRAEDSFQNLLSNSIDAFHKVIREQKLITISINKKKDFVEVIFTDNASGMAEEVRKRIFDPFFSTKEVGKGMGLGMALVFDNISNLNGEIKVESVLGKGTSMILSFPYYLQHQIPDGNEILGTGVEKKVAVVEANTAKSPNAKKLKLAVIDDEPDIVEVVSLYLEEKFEIFPYTDPSKFLIDFEKVNPDLILSDFKMPRVSGIELAKKVQEKKSTIKFFLMTGHEQNIPQLLAENIAIIDTIEKPFNEDDLNDLLKEFMI